MGSILPAENSPFSSIDASMILCLSARHIFADFHGLSLCRIMKFPQVRHIDLCVTIELTKALIDISGTEECRQPLGQNWIDKGQDHAAGRRQTQRLFGKMQWLLDMEDFLSKADV